MDAAPVVISVRGLGKRYRIRRQGQTTLKSAALRLLRRAPVREEEFWALRDVSFEVRQGEMLGVIGRNGAGKSTLLGLIVGTITPTTGEVETTGRISSLLELGAGFHPDLTGRENVYLNGSILGLRRADIARRFDAIVAFSELERFIDVPVKHYSSGMFVRLAFSVAMEVDPDILIVDEVLSVGDERFREKCRDRIGEFRRRGKTFLIVSHEMETIQSLCDRAILLERGETVLMDRPVRAVNEYHVLNAPGPGEGPARRESGSREIEIAAVEVLDAAGRPAAAVNPREPLLVRMRWRARQPVDDPVFGFALADAEERTLYGTNTAIDGFALPRAAGEGVVELAIDSLPFLRGRYHLTVAVHDREHRVYHRLDNAATITVLPDGEHAGAIRLSARWRTGA